MYRGRLLLWVGLIAFMMFVTSINACISEIEDFSVYTETGDTSFDNKITTIHDTFDTTYNVVKNKENADIIITNADNERTIEGYKKYPTELYTPIVMYIYCARRDSSTGFRKEQSNVYYKDFKTILEAFEENKTYEDIGIDEKTLSGPIKLAIPTQKSLYYKDIEDLFYYTLNDNQKPNETQKEALRERVEKLLNKCTKEEDIATVIIENYKNNKTPHETIYITTESTAFNAPTDRSVFTKNSGNYNYDIIYMDYSIAHRYDLYIKEDENVDHTFDVFRNSQFQTKTGVRIVNKESAFCSSANIYGVSQIVYLMN